VCLSRYGVWKPTAREDSRGSYQKRMCRFLAELRNGISIASLNCKGAAPVGCTLVS
jgi:hypothetical protein